MKQIKHVFQGGNFIQPNSSTKSIDIISNHLLAADEDGTIVHFEHEDTLASQKIIFNSTKYKFIKLSKHQFLSPGFVDLHIHAPQYCFTGTATDRPLMGEEGWLEKYTFPVERSLQDLDTARLVYERVVSATLRCGTTTALYFATLHVEPTKVLCDVVCEKGQRGLVGKVCMDRHSPFDYCESLEENVQGTMEIIEYIQNTQAYTKNLLYPVITPRFIPTCSTGLMKALGKLAKKYNCHVQSHVSESMDEVEFSKSLDSSGLKRSDTQVFQEVGLLTSKTVLAHAPFINDEDSDLLRRYGSSIASCPLSNFYFAGASLRCKYFMNKGNKIGMGTDVAGGYSPSMMNCCRSAVIASRSLLHSQTAVMMAMNDKENNTNSFGKSSDFEKDELLDYKESFYLATYGGAEALSLDHIIGALKVGMKLDVILLTAIDNESGNIDIFESDSTDDVFQKICCLGDDRNVKEVYINGRQVK